MVSPNALAWSADVKLAEPVAPPREIVTSLPFFWQVLISSARNWQLGILVPGKTPESTLLQLWKMGSRACVSRRCRDEGRDEQLTLARLRDGTPPAPKKTFTNAMGITLIVSS